jgi:hypothetical protein
MLFKKYPSFAFVRPLYITCSKSFLGLALVFSIPQGVALWKIL